MVYVEKSFPRGGAYKQYGKDNANIRYDAGNRSGAGSSRGISSNSVMHFGATTIKKKQTKLHKSKRKLKKIGSIRHKNKSIDNNDVLTDASGDSDNNNAEQIEAISAELLNYKTIVDGMLIMGCIKSIEPTYLEIALPGRITGRVSVTLISQSYLNILNDYVNDAENNVENYRTLSDLFSIGQIVCCKVIRIEADKMLATKINIQLSMQPSHIQSDFIHRNLMKNMYLSVAISQIEEHGYVIETGISNLHGFLPFENCNVGNTTTNITEDNRLSIGQLVFCKIDKVNVNSNSSIVVLKLINIQDMIFISDLITPNLNNILPITVIEFKVKRILKNGLQGVILNDSFTGYVNEHHLRKASDKPSDYKIDRVVKARILYIQPITKLIYLTLNLDNARRENTSLQHGQVIEDALVLRVGTGGVILRLSDTCKGLLTFKSIRIDFNTNADIDTLKLKYHQNSSHTVRIVGYDLMDSIFICSVDPNLINEKYFSLNDSECGSFVNGKILNKLDDGGYFLTVGKIKGYLQKLEIAPNTPDSKLKVDSIIRARVIKILPRLNSIFLTNHKEYMTEKAPILTKLEEIDCTIDYYGMVVKMYSHGTLISFFNNIKGFLYNESLPEHLQQLIPIHLQIGQIISVRVIKIMDDKIDLTISEKSLVKFGEILTGRICQITESGIELKFKNKLLPAFIPIMFLSKFPQLAASICKSFQINQQIQTCCLIPETLYSLRDIEQFDKSASAVELPPPLTWSDIKIGQILPGYIQNVENDIIEIKLLIENYNKLIKIHSKMLLENYRKPIETELIANQLIYVKVLGKIDDLQHLTCTGKLAEVWNGNFIETGTIMNNYFMDVEQLRKWRKDEAINNDNDSDIGNFKVGDIVMGKIGDINKETKSLNLLIYKKYYKNFMKNNLYVSNVNGIIKPNKWSKKIANLLDQDVKCIILWIDYCTNTIYLTMRKRILRRVTDKHGKIEEKLDLLKIARGVKADVLFIHNDFVIVSPRKLTKKFVFIPTRFHFNDFQPILRNAIELYQIVRITILKLDGIHLIGMFKYVYNQLYQMERSIKRKRHELIHAVGKKRKLTHSQTVQEAITSAKNHLNNDLALKLDQVDGTIDNLDSNLSFKSIQLDGLIEDNVLLASDESSIAKHRKLTFVSIQLDGGINNRKQQSASTSKQSTSTAKQSFKKSKRRIRQYTQKRSNINNKPSPGEQNFVDTNLIWLKQKKLDKREKFVKLPGISNFWATATNNTANQSNNNMDSSSDDDSDDNDNTTNTTKKPSINDRLPKKLSANDRFRAAIVEETRLREIEEFNAQPITNPTTVEQFERILIQSPNNSFHWINYMVFHVQAMELDKARIVARRALKTIQFRDEQELLNVWVAFLNLELRYGTKESYDIILSESLQLNDPFKIYSKVLQILIDCKRTADVNKIVDIMLKKFKSNINMWPIIATTYYEIGQTKIAQQLLSRSLLSLPEKDHINMIVKFAVIHNKYGEKDASRALYDKILLSYPKRVDIWSQYIDQLVKDNEIDVARQKLDAAVTQKIPMKKMRTLFKKYLDFEEKFGNEENVRKVKMMATNYVKHQIND